MSASVFRLLVAASSLVDALVILAVAGARSRRNPAPLGIPALLLAATAGALACAAKVALWIPSGLGPFGLMHVVYASAVLTIPIAAFVLLVARRRGALNLTPPASTLTAIALAPFALGVYASVIEPFRLQLETARLPLSPAQAGERPIRLGVLSDLQTDHIGSYERSAVARLLAQRPDVILIPGDLFQASAAIFESELPALRDLLASLDAPGGVYLVPGDVDPPLESLVRAISGTRVQLLVESVATTRVGDRTLRIAGITTDYAGPSAARTIARLEDGPPDAARILLSHRPDAALVLTPGSNVDLVVSGHTHGGQVVIPGFGPPMTLSHVPRHVAAGGLHRVNGHALYVSRGVGHERGQAPRLRVLCPPEISLITLE